MHTADFHVVGGGLDQKVGSLEKRIYKKKKLIWRRFYFFCPHFERATSEIPVNASIQLNGISFVLLTALVTSGSSQMSMCSVDHPE